jgi:transcriptional accessory protein Tex/SPT6
MAKAKNKYPLVQASVHPEIWAKVKEIARELGIPYNQAVTRAFQEFIESQTFSR